MTMTKYNFIFGYSIFFAISQIILVGYAGNIISSPFSSLQAPVCSLGLIVIDGILTCFFNYLTYFFAFFAISSTFAVLESVIIIPFVIILGVIVLEFLRGTG